MSLEINPHPSFASNFYGRESIPAVEELASGAEKNLVKEMSIPDYILSVYGVKPRAFSGYYSFLSRDGEDKSYEPGVEDPFVFRNKSSINQFHSQTHKYCQSIYAQLKAKGYPFKNDKYKGNVPDHDKAVELLKDNSSQLSAVYDKEKTTIAYLVGESDIAAKVSLVRTVKPGWFAVSYDGKVAPGWNAFARSEAIIGEAVRVISKSKLFKDLYKETLDSQGDPLDTNTGAPLYSSEVSAQGTPVAKLAYAELFKDSPYKELNWTKFCTWKATRGADPQLKTEMFNVAAIRRLQPGTKKSLVWRRSATGYRLEGAVRGDTTNRVAFMPEYLQNLALSPLQSLWKTIRKCIPGTYHDGTARTSYMKTIQQQDPFICEADYSNYDRTIPVNGIARLHDVFTANLGLDPSTLQFCKEMLASTYSQINFIWPDQPTSNFGKGWLFKPKTNALLSGLKITSEVGTFCNLIVVCQSLLDSKVLSEQELLSHLTMFVRSGKLDYESKPPLFLIQSDDTCLIHKDKKKWLAMMDHFKINGVKAGFKTEVSLGDRFLMRHISSGIDIPVCSRVLQNTLSNEDSYKDPLIFCVGLAARTDGLGAFRTVDPFQLGKDIKEPSIIPKLEKETLTIALNFLTTAQMPVKPAITFLETLIKLIDLHEKGAASGKTALEKSVNKMRLDFSRLLAQREAKQATSKDLVKTWVASLLKDKHHPATALLIDTVSSLSPEYASLFKEMENREHSVYLFIMKKIGIPTSFI